MNIRIEDACTVRIHTDYLASFARTKSGISKDSFGFSAIPSPSKFGDAQAAEVTTAITCGEYTVHIDGFVDRVYGGEVPRLEFIKKLPRKPRSILPMTDPQFIASALISSYCYCEEYSCEEVTVIATYYNEASGESVSFSSAMDFEILGKLFAVLWERASLLINFACSTKIDGIRQFKKMRFPYSTVRESQKEFIEEAFCAIAKKQRLIVSAPTGIGKTMSVLYSSLKAIGAGYADKIFYLTAKASTGKVASDAAADIAKSCPALRCITVYAKERLCPEDTKAKTACSVFCRRLDEIDGVTYEQRRDAAMVELLQNNIIDAVKLTETANKYFLCPYELSLDLSLYAHIVICDYNYVFDNRVRFQRYFSNGIPKERYVFAIDEAHNLPPRVRAVYSSTVKSSSFEKLLSDLPSAFPGDSEMREAVEGVLDALKQFPAADISDGSQESPSYQASADLPATLIERLSRFRGVSGRRIRADRDFAEGYLGELYAEAGKFLNSAAAYSETFRTFIEHRKDEISISLLSIDPSKLINSALSLASSCVLFSATLSPFEYFSEQFGSADAKILDLPSPYEKGNLAILAYDGISTRYSDRSRTLIDTAEAIAAVTDAKEGNYLVYFPSYEYMKRAAKIYKQIAPYSRIVCQSSGMSLKERNRFLSYFKENSEPTVGFCVLGGIFSEGIDLPGNRLIGSVIIGIGMGALSSEDNLMREYYGENGTEFAYIYPGINRVLQAAGRVIRSENDKGAVVLIDDRYSDPSLQKLLPKHWSNMRFVGNLPSLSHALDEFWNKT